MAAQKAAVNLFSALKVGSYTLKNRVLMAPLTRCRASPTGVPTPLMKDYYSPRAEDSGLVITEATLVSALGRGYRNTPGIYNDEQAEQWKVITDDIHSKGGRVFVQLWHQGRTANKALTPNKATPVGPSEGIFIGADGVTKCPSPRALETAEIPGIVQEYATATKYALKAGFDGVEVHAANGYLPHQFLCDGSNKRTDTYGGSIENRARFLLEVMQHCVQVAGAEKVGVRVSPAAHWQDMYDTDPIALWTYVGQKLAAMKDLAYLHVVEPRDGGFGATTDPADLKLTASFFKEVTKFTGPIFSAGGHDQASGAEYIESGKADAIVYGRWYIANPDLAKRFAKGAALNPYDRTTFYGGGAKGYTDYPTMK